ncbi:MAG TPA: GAF domain-containing protein [Pyrinomonadaceae bacterium]|nr:GAF domain-containing protein [Pyrinomonadaceae bacterium]
MSENLRMPGNENPELSSKIQRLIETVDIANLLVEPLTRSIERLLSASATALNASEASVLIRDGDEGDLRFLAAIGTVAEQLMNMRIPAGKGIAGFVMSSGQPMAVSDVGVEEAFYAEVDKATGFSTQMILATPLRHNDEIIGVLEYINRPGAPPWEPFSPEEMDKAALCGEAVASLVSAYESAKLFRDLGEKMIETDEDLDLDAVRAWLRQIRDAADHREMLELALLLREVAGRGEPERLICKELLESIIRYSDSKSETSYLG